ncbi:MAG: TonB-dependent receptor, partial [Proteobacteria bacterium]|nr:TonB-dependent receptor [Pseudomonadota bacterium]
NMPLSDEWALRFFGIASTNDSFLTNTNAPRQNGGTGNQPADIGQVDETTLRLSLGGNFSDAVSMFATVRYNDFDGPNNVWSIEPDGNLEYPTDINFSVNGRHEKETFAATLELDFELGGGDIIYLGSITNTESDRLTDLDTTNEFVIDFFRPHELDVLTQELRYNSDSDGPLQWQAGLYYLLYERDIRTTLNALGGFGFFDPTTGLPVPPPNDGTEPDLVVALPWEFSDRERTQFAGYGSFSYRTGQFEFGGGLRLDNWQSDRCVDATAGAVNVPAFCGSQDDTETLVRASVSWFTNDDRGMFYGTFSQGFEPGDFNLNNRPGETVPLGYGPEHSDQFEVGYKSRLANDRLILEAAAFYIDYEARQFELQENDPVSGGFTEGIVNVGDSEHFGIEVDIMAELSDNWTLSAGAGWLDVEWKSGTTSPTTGADLSGMTPPNTAEFSGVVAIDYDRELGQNSSIFGRLQLTHRDDSTTNAQFFDAPGDAFPFWDNPSFTVLELSLGYSIGNWTIDLLVQNLTDEEYYIDAQEFPNFGGSAHPGSPEAVIIGTAEQRRRTILSLRYAF